MPQGDRPTLNLTGRQSTACGRRRDVQRDKTDGFDDGPRDRGCGIDHVGPGSDFAGTATTGFDPSQLAAATRASIEHGFSNADIANVVGGNALPMPRAGIVARRHLFHANISRKSRTV